MARYTGPDSPRPRFAYYDEPTWFLLAFVAAELAVVIVLLAVLVARG